MYNAKTIHKPMYCLWCMWYGFSFDYSNQTLRNYYFWIIFILKYIVINAITILAKENFSFLLKYMLFPIPKSLQRGVEWLSFNKYSVFNVFLRHGFCNSKDILANFKDWCKILFKEKILFGFQVATKINVDVSQF